MNIRRQRKALSGLFLGAWLFALFVGIANACMQTSADDGDVEAQRMATPFGSGHDGPSAHCLEACANDTPVFTKTQLVQDQPAGQLPSVASLSTPRVSVSATAVRVEHLELPPPGGSVLLRSGRLAL